MPTLSSLLSVVKSTDNFWDAFLLRFSKAPKTIKFRNGVEIESDYRQYAQMRDWLEHLRAHSFSVEKVKDDSYLIETPSFTFKTQSILTARPFFEFLLLLIAHGWQIKRDSYNYKVSKGSTIYTVTQVNQDLYHLQTENLEIVGPKEAMNVFFFECENGLYDYNYNNKTVLDIGGFCGETAAFFSSKGAKKVLVYEPVSAHHKFIQKNTVLNNINAEIFVEGVGEKDETVIVNYDDFNTSFGLYNKGQNVEEIRTRNISSVLQQSRADVAKIDCEGAEICLINVSEKILRLIDFYFIETHTPEIKEAVTHKFEVSGFEMAREPVTLSKGITMLYFQKSATAIESSSSTVDFSLSPEVSLLTL
ncbi:MAG: FkbM family methyltransferase [Candidatus Bathyarchaeia archaeon]|jgi:FkbM family methyltransferase